MDGANIITGIGTGGMIGLLYVIWKMFKHSRCRSNCCGRESSLSVDLEKGFETKKDIEKPVIHVETK